MPALKRILLVEDCEKDIELTLAALEECHLGNEVVVVRDGDEALDYLKHRGQFSGQDDGRPVVVLLDVKLPKLDGLEVLRRIRADAELQRLPVVMLTASREERDLVSSYQLGANAYMVKPVDYRQFVDSVKRLGFFWGILNEPPPDGFSETPSHD